MKFDRRKFFELFGVALAAPKVQTILMKPRSAGITSMGVDMAKGPDYTALMTRPVGSNCVVILESTAHGAGNWWANQFNNSNPLRFGGAYSQDEAFQVNRPQVFEWPREGNNNA